MKIEELKKLTESEDKIEFKEAKHNFSFAGSEHKEQEERRKCFLGYIVALANENGGLLVLGMKDKLPHDVVGSDFALGKIGEIEDAIYRRLAIRVRFEEVYENKLRVLITKIPSRPIGKTLKFEGVPLMRIGDSLRNMSDEELYSILSEQEPDFTDKICDGLTYNDLDENAIELLKKQYSRKQNNYQFLTQTTEQILSDLNLTINGKLKYATLILLGCENALKKYLPQSEVRLEYRNSSTQITFDDRIIICKPYFLLIDELWDKINLRNGKVPVQEGAYIFDIPFFNQEVIREGINNAISHRDYRKQSEILIKQSPHELNINSPGGFPLGVTIENLLTVNSTPRNRLLADILAKTGAVERSGQGIDKMFYQCLSEAKSPPDYSTSDNYQVNVNISAVVKDKAFAIFIKDYQSGQMENDKLSVFEIITLDKIRAGVEKEKLQSNYILSLLERGLIEKLGMTRNLHYRLSSQYYSFIDKEGIYTKDSPSDIIQIQLKIVAHLEKFKSAKIGDFVDLFEGSLSREQTKYMIYRFVSEGFLEKSGNAVSTKYLLSSNFEISARIMSRAVQLGIEEMKKKGELSDVLKK
jgi:ATP-dependent DNA helicase RecG